MSRRALLIVNRNSSRAAETLQPCLDILRHEGDVETEVFFSESREHVAHIVAEHGDGVDMIIMAGGDGTLNAAVDTLYKRDLALAVLPLGTANDLARTLGIPADPEAACHVIAYGRPHRIDLGRVNGKLFLNVASIGAAAQLSHNLDRELKARWGVLSYPIRVREVVDEANAFTAEIEDETGRTITVRSIQVAVGNGRCYGGGMRVAEDSAIDDQRLDLYSLEPQSLWRLIVSLPAIRAGRHQDLEGSTHMSGQRFTVRTDRPMDVSTDGEVTGETPAFFEVLPRALTVIVPRDVAGPGMGEAMLRDDKVVALDDVIVALKRSIEDMRDEVDSHEVADALTDRLTAIADRRGPLVERLEDEVRAMGDLPSSPDADRQAFTHIATRFKALLSGDDAGPLVEAALDDEREILEAVDTALAVEDMPESAATLLHAARADVEDAMAALKALRES